MNKDLQEMIFEIERMSNLYKRVILDDAKRSYSQYVDLIIEQTDYCQEHKERLRAYWEGLIE